MNSLKSQALALGAAVLAAPAWAQPAGPSPDGDPIIVYAARSPTPIDAGTAAASVLTAEDLARRQTVFVVDALATQPGVTVAQNGPFGGLATVRIRGAASEQTLVLVDGIVVNDPTSPGGGFDAAFLDAHDIARIEVLRGPQSTLWGSDAIGGVISITTRRPTPGLSAAASAEGGSFGTLRGTGSFGYGGRGLDLRLGASAITTDGISKADENDGNREADPYDSASFDGRLGLALSPDFRVEAFGRVSDSDAAFDSFGLATGVQDGDATSRTEERQGGLAARLQLFDGRLENLLLLTRADIERRFFSGGAPSFTAEGSRRALRYQGAARPNDQLAVTFGAEREDSDFKALGDTSIVGLFVLAEAKPAAGLTLTGGLRRDDHSTFGETTTGRLGLRWDLGAGAGLRASWGQGFKAPTVFQVSGGGFVPPNPNLQPEEAEGWDAAVFVSLLDGRFVGELGVFDLETENLISFTVAGYINVARAESSGVELTTRWAPTEALTFTAAYTHTEASDAGTGARLLSIPENAAFLEADWRATPALGLTAQVRYNGEEADFVRPRNPSGTLSEWVRIDVAGRYRLSERVELYGRIDNLLDETYQDIFGYGAPGVSAYGGVRVRLR